jgi:hypothetical protein
MSAHPPSVCPKCGGERAGIDLDEGIVTCLDCREQRPVGPGDDPHADTVALLREVTTEAHAIFGGLADPTDAALRLRYRQQEDRAASALYDFVDEGGAWAEVGDLIAESEAWWVYRMLVERARGIVPDQIRGGA